MGVYTKKDGRIYVVHTVEGKQKWKPFGRGEVARFQAEQFNRELQGRKGKLELGGLTVALLYSQYREKHQVEESTFRMDAYKMSVLVSKLGGFQADMLTTDHLHRYVEKRLKEGVKRVTIANEIRRLKAGKKDWKFFLRSRWKANLPVFLMGGRKVFLCALRVSA